MRRLSTVALLTLATGGACGGNAIIDGSDSGDGGAATSASSTSTSGDTSSTSDTSSTGSASTSGNTSTTGSGSSGSGSGGGSVDCQQLTAEMEQALVTATQCNPALSILQCSGANIAKGHCDCAVVANDLYPAEAVHSFELGSSYHDAGCEYSFCESGCYPTDAPWFCSPTTKRCEPAYD